MKITREIYNSILQKCSGFSVETGGIIGGKNNIISEFEFDMGTNSSTEWNYYPDVERLNSCIENWQNEDVEFYGIIHSHFQDTQQLSFGDGMYIQKIMLSMPAHINHLYFPIVLPQREIIAFRAIRLESEINIIKDDIKIVK